MVLRPQSDDGDRHLVTQQCAVVDGPIELVRVTHVESCLVHGLTADDRVAVLEDQPGKLAMRYAQGRSRRIEVLAQLGNDLLRDGTVARRSDDPLPPSEMADDRAQRSA